ncbi:MAG: type II secretion system F family protein [Euryarchaeota archaeon]|nr:type II secretion system F family protein [Euryarchaeota archaeon]
MENEEEGAVAKTLRKIGDTVITGLEKTGRVTSEIVIRKPTKEEITASERVHEKEEKKKTARMKRIREIERRHVVTPEEEFERIELERPLTERLSGVFYRPFRSSAERFSRFFTGLDEDLYKANMRIPMIQYIAFIMGVGILAGIGVGIAVAIFMTPIFALPVGAMAGVIALFFGRSYPKQVAKARSAEINKQIPYALRHMATQLSAGIGLFETMVTVAKSNYGAFSEEFERAIADVERGLSTEEAFKRLEERVESDALSHTLRNITRSLRTGGDLAKTLSMLADEVAFELRMKLRDYAQTLNTYGLIYLFIAAVGPVMFMALYIAISAITKTLMFPVGLLAIIYLLGMPFMIGFFMTMIKRAEPKI